MVLRMRVVLALGIVAYSAHWVYAIGCGGILNLLPQAEARVGEERIAADIYLHPMEGAFLVCEEGRTYCLAADKANDRGLRIERSDLIFTEGMADAKHDIPYVLLSSKPRYTAKGVRIEDPDSGRLIIVTIPR